MSATAEGMWGRDKNKNADKPAKKPLKLYLKDLPYDSLISFGGVITIIFLGISIVSGSYWMWVTGGSLIGKLIGVAIISATIVGSFLLQFYSGLAFGSGLAFVGLALWIFIAPAEYWSVYTTTGTLNLLENTKIAKEERSADLYEQGKFLMEQKQSQADTSEQRAANAPNTYMSVGGEAEERARQSTNEATDIWNKLMEMPVVATQDTLDDVEATMGANSRQRNLGFGILCSLFPALWAFFRGRIHGRRDVDVETIEGKGKGKKP